ncbi:MAG: FMN-binding protein [Candidatus Sericytochromatia bacterium]|nr:FMN-binding protein [Candidatus Tanganyikabacteria bacterium]
MSLFRIPACLLASLMVWLAVGTVAAADDEAPEVYEKVYLTLPQALGIALPAEDAVEERVLAPTRAQRRRIERALGRKLPEATWHVHRSHREGRTTGWAFAMDEQGKYYPITFIVGLTPDGAVRDVAVMVYREKRGDAVHRRRFLNQFQDKTVEDPLMVNRDIVHLTGATVSSWSIAAGVRKAVVIHEVLLREEGSRP